MNAQIIILLKEGCGIRSISRILNISTKTVITRILKIASNTEEPPIPFGRKYQIDELITFIGNKMTRPVPSNKREFFSISFPKTVHFPSVFPLRKTGYSVLGNVAKYFLSFHKRMCKTGLLFLFPDHE